MQFIQHHSGSSGNLYQLVSYHGQLVIDPGVPIRKVKHALDFKLRAVDAALISHSHADHCKAVPDLIKYGVDCFMTKQTAAAIGITGHRVNIIDIGKQFRVAGWTAIAFETEHDCNGAVGFLISDGREKLLFATDTYYIRPKFKGLRIIAVECNWSKETIDPDIDPARKQRLYKSHFSLSNVKKFLQANDLSKVCEIHLLHLSRDNSDAALFQREIQALTGKPVYVAKP